MKRLLILGAGFYHKRVYRALRKGNYYLIGVDRDPNASAAAFADEFYPVDISDEDGIVNLAKHLGVHAVMPLNEFGMRSHAYAVEKLGILGNNLDSAEKSTDKEKMRLCWKDASLPQPLFYCFGNNNQEMDLKSARKAVDKIKFPCIIKPADSGGSGRGVLVLNNINELAEGIAFARPFCRNGRFVIEEFVEGTEVTVEGLVFNGEHTILAVSDKEKPPLRTRVATSLNYPADFNQSTMAYIHEVVHNAVKSLGLTHSATHTECIVTPEGTPLLIETGARGGGGHIFSDIVELVSGINMPCALAQILCGEEPELSNIKHQGACYRFFNPPQGIIKNIRGFKIAKKMDGVVDIGTVKIPGDTIKKLSNSLERAGFVLTKGKDRYAAWSKANQVERIVQFIVEPENVPN